MRLTADKGPKEQLADIAGAIALGVPPKDCIVALKRVIDRLPDEDQWAELGWDEEQRIEEDVHRQDMEDAHRWQVEDRLRCGRLKGHGYMDDWPTGTGPFGF